ncbi:MAG: hypothetical protein M3N47_08215 [Chloroflexota bacterium]|nr:hypothetical protein [Chloroflexota bacterium]
MELVEMTVDELCSVRESTKANGPLEATVAAVIAADDGRASWEGGERWVRRLLERADEVEFVHLGRRGDVTVAELLGRQPLAGEVLAELIPRWSGAWENPGKTVTRPERFPAVPSGVETSR